MRPWSHTIYINFSYLILLVFKHAVIRSYWPKVSKRKCIYTKISIRLRISCCFFTFARENRIDSMLPSWQLKWTNDHSGTWDLSANSVMGGSVTSKRNHDFKILSMNTIHNCFTLSYTTEMYYRECFWKRCLRSLHEVLYDDLWTWPHEKYVFIVFKSRSS